MRAHLDMFLHLQRQLCCGQARIPPGHGREGGHQDHRQRALQGQGGHDRDRGTLRMFSLVTMKSLACEAIWCARPPWQLNTNPSRCLFSPILVTGIA